MNERNEINRMTNEELRNVFQTAYEAMSKVLKEANSSTTLGDLRKETTKSKSQLDEALVGISQQNKEPLVEALRGLKIAYNAIFNLRRQSNKFILQEECETYMSMINEANDLLTSSPLQVNDDANELQDAELERTVKVKDASGKKLEGSGNKLEAAQRHTQGRQAQRRKDHERKAAERKAAALQREGHGDSTSLSSSSTTSTLNQAKETELENVAEAETLQTKDQSSDSTSLNSSTSMPNAPTTEEISGGLFPPTAHASVDENLQENVTEDTVSDKHRAALPLTDLQRLKLADVQEQMDKLVKLEQSSRTDLRQIAVLGANSIMDHKKTNQRNIQADEVKNGTSRVVELKNIETDEITSVNDTQDLGEISGKQHSDVVLESEHTDGGNIINNDGNVETADSGAAALLNENNSNAASGGQEPPILSTQVKNNENNEAPNSLNPQVADKNNSNTVPTVDKRIHDEVIQGDVEGITGKQHSEVQTLATESVKKITEVVLESGHTDGGNIINNDGNVETAGSGAAALLNENNSNTALTVDKRIPDEVIQGDVEGITGKQRNEVEALAKEGLEQIINDEQSDFKDLLDKQVKDAAPRRTVTSSNENNEDPNSDNPQVVDENNSNTGSGGQEPPNQEEIDKNILEAMDAAITAAKKSYGISWTGATKEKILESWRNEYTSPTQEGMTKITALRGFIFQVIEARRPLSIFGKADDGYTASAKAFYQALGDDATRQQVADALGVRSLSAPGDGKHQSEFANVAISAQSAERNPTPTSNGPQS